MDIAGMDNLTAPDSKPHHPYNASSATFGLPNDIKEVRSNAEMTTNPSLPAADCDIDDVQQTRSVESCVNIDKDTKPMVDETLSIFPFVCGICYVMFQDIQKYYSHIQSVHEDMEKYFHSHVPELEREDANVYFCGKCSYVSPSLCSLNAHLVNVENAAAYKLVPATRTAYPFSEDDISKETTAALFDTGTDSNMKQVDTKLKSKRVGNRKTKVKSEPIESEQITGLKSCSVSPEQLPNLTKVKDRKPRKRVRKTSKLTKTGKIDKENPTEGISESLNTKDPNDYGSDTTIENDEFSESQMDKKLKRQKNSGKASKSKSATKRKSDPQDETLLPCHKCGRQVKRHYLHKHMQSHVETKNYQCQVCELRFKCQSNLTAHLRLVHTDGTFVCEQCGKSFKNRAYLRQHVKTHRERLIQCPHCPKSFTYKQRLTKHLVVHKAEPQFKCELCDKRYTFQWSLSVHKQRAHQDARPHTCHKCGMTFKVFNGVQQHLKIHEPPQHACVVCGKAFVYAKNRKTHMKTHINKGEYVPERLDNQASIQPDKC